MTWTTIAPSGATQPVTLVLFAVMALTLAYALGLLHRMLQMRRMEGLMIPAEGLEEDQDQPVDERKYRRRYNDAHGRLEP